MNRTRVLALAEYIEYSDSYSQSNWFHACGSPGCIAGHAIALFRTRKHYVNEWVKKPPPRNAAGEAKRYLGLNDEQSNTLFDGYPFSPYLNGKPSRYDAAATLRNLAATGKVEWRKIDE